MPVTRRRSQALADTIKMESNSPHKQQSPAQPEQPRQRRSRKSVSIVLHPEKPQRRRQLVGEAAKFPLVAIGSLCVMSMGYSVVREYTGSAAEYASVTRPLETWYEVGLLASWRVFELALGWYGGFDSHDLAALAVLSHGPTLYLLHTFYGVSLATTLASLLVEMACSFVPFSLLRPLSEPHLTPTSGHFPSEKEEGAIPAPNRAVVANKFILVLTTLLGAGIHGVVIAAALEGSLIAGILAPFSASSSSSPPPPAPFSSEWASVFVPTALLLGAASRIYVFTPVAAQGATEADAWTARFDPMRSGLGETVWYNFWGWRSATKTAVVRTAAAALVGGGHTFLTLAYGIKGVGKEAAGEYAAVWVAATILAGVGLGAVGSVA